MTALLARALRLLPGERGPVLALGFLLLGNSLAMQISYVTSVSGFLSEVGVNQILFVWLASSLLFMPLTALQSLIMDRFDRVTLLSGVIFGFAVMFVALRLMFAAGAPSWLTYSLLYILAELQWLIFPLVFWTLANDLFGMAQAKRLFPVIASWGFAGRIAGLGIAVAAPAAVTLLGTSLDDLLLLNALIYLGANLLIVARFRRPPAKSAPRRRETLQETLQEGRGFVREVASFRYLTLALIALAISETIIEFHFLVLTDSAFADRESYQIFYGFFRLGITLASLLVQGFATGRLIEHMGLRNSFLIAPLTVLGGALSLLLHPGLLVSITAMAFLRLVRDTVEESSIKSFQSLVPSERRGRVSTFMDGYLAYLGSALGCIITLAILQLGPWLDQVVYVYVGAAVAVSTLAVWAVYRMREVYESSLLNWRLKRRHRGGTVINKLDF